ncbi:MAG: endolytic transglycosylase MltG [Proteobacteria bacterium]|nr:endolytic transglycosylase MltG [Pseudomonadota bacterium]
MRMSDVYRTGVRWFLRLVYLVFGLVLAGAGVVVYLAWQLLTPPGGKQARTFVLDPGRSAAEVSRQLESGGFIRSAYAFRLMLKVTHTASRLQAGEHTLSPSMTALQVRDELMKVVERPAVRLTIPEGLTRKEVAARVARTLPAIKSDDFQGFTLYPRTTFPEKTWLPGTDLEGYLFPDTYELEAKSTTRQVVERMLKRFEEVVLVMPEVKARRFPGGLTFQQMIVLASLIEAEAKVDKDRPLIAGVYLNRLRKQMRLECDATIIYALGTRKVLSLADLKYESPYNTYLYEGLPPGPICNPGRKSIEAALHPKGDFLYYVRDDVKGDGSHVFGRTFAEHEANIRKVSR